MSAGFYAYTGLACGVIFMVLLALALGAAAKHGDETAVPEPACHRLDCVPDPLESLYALPARDPEKVQ